MLSRDVELRSTIVLGDGTPVHVPLRDIEEAQKAFEEGPYDVDGELRSYTIPWGGKNVNVEVGWGRDSYVHCDRPNGLSAEQERVIEQLVTVWANDAWDAADEYAE